MQRRDWRTGRGAVRILWGRLLFERGQILADDFIRRSFETVTGEASEFFDVMDAKSSRGAQSFTLDVGGGIVESELASGGEVRGGDAADGSGKPVDK